jgi:hypothetical protein
MQQLQLRPGLMLAVGIDANDEYRRAEMTGARRE